jgi:hypothetical protein
VKAQYPAAAGLGNDAKKTRPSRKGRSKRSAFGLASRSATASIGRSSRPGRDTSLKTLTQSGSCRILGFYFRVVPAGLDFLEPLTAILIATS